MKENHCFFLKGFIYKINSLPLQCAQRWELSRWFRGVQDVPLPRCSSSTSDLVTALSWVPAYLGLAGVSVTQTVSVGRWVGRISIRKNPFLTDLDSRELHWSQCTVALNKWRSSTITTFISESLQTSPLVSTSTKVLKCKLSTQ